LFRSRSLYSSFSTIHFIIGKFLKHVLLEICANKFGNLLVIIGTSQLSFICFGQIIQTSGFSSKYLDNSVIMFTSFIKISGFKIRIKSQVTDFAQMLFHFVYQEFFLLKIVLTFRFVLFSRFLNLFNLFKIFSSFLLQELSTKIISNSKSHSCLLKKSIFSATLSAFK
jgi:hypothetical protein